VSDYQAQYEDSFIKDLGRYKSLRKRIERRVGEILADPYANTECLGWRPGGLDLRGCRSARINRNLRIIFVICEECRSIEACQFCFCEGLADQTVVFLLVRPHQKAYFMREEPDVAYG
jgi:Txe/YoeB family toxin of Txe-Axe toxin-antitoxin module